METNILAHQLHGVSVGMQKADGYVNATKACEAYKVATGKTKRTENWTRSARAKSYIAYVAAVTRKSVTELVIIRKGGAPEEQGTWIHPDLAIAFGTWLSVEFEYQLSQWGKEWEQSQHPSAKANPEVVKALHPTRRSPGGDSGRGSVRGVVPNTFVEVG